MVYIYTGMISEGRDRLEWYIYTGMISEGRDRLEWYRQVDPAKLNTLKELIAAPDYKVNHELALITFLFRFYPNYGVRALRAHLLFQLLIVASSVSIKKNKKFADFIIFFRAFSKFYKNKKLLNNFF